MEVVVVGLYSAGHFVFSTGCGGWHGGTRVLLAYTVAPVLRRTYIGGLLWWVTGLGAQGTWLWGNDTVFSYLVSARHSPRTLFFN